MACNVLPIAAWHSREEERFVARPQQKADEKGTILPGSWEQFMVVKQKANEKDKI